MICIYARRKREIPDGAQYCPWCGKKQTHEAKKKRHRRPSGTGAVYKNSSTRKRAKPWVALKNGRSIGQCFATEEEYPYLVGGWKEFDTIQKHYNKPNLASLYNEMEKLLRTLAFSINKSSPMPFLLRV